jgi:putative cardiolipin synthase
LAPRRSPLSQSPQSPAALPVGGCAAVLHDAPRPVSHAIDEPQHTQLARRFATQLPSEPGLTGFRLLTSAQDALLARAALAEVAPRALDLQYCVVADDETSTVLLYQALRAAQRGVRVRLLIDDLDVGDRDSHLAILASHPNVQLRVFSPFAWRGSPSLAWALDYLTGGARLNRRMHNKLWIVDNAAVVIGRRNLGDAYFKADSLNNFADLDVLLVGPLVAAASRSFDDYWNSEGRCRSWPTQVRHPRPSTRRRVRTREVVDAQHIRVAAACAPRSSSGRRPPRRPMNVRAVGDFRSMDCKTVSVAQDAVAERLPYGIERARQVGQAAEVDAAFAWRMKVRPARGEQVEFDRECGVLDGVGA